MLPTRTIFIISDGTGITAEHLGNSLLSQFDNINFERKIIPYIDTIEKATAFAQDINQLYASSKLKPIIFATLVNPAITAIIQQTQAKLFDLFNTFLMPLEQELQQHSSYTVGKTHGVNNIQSYSERIEAINYALSHDDGIKVNDYARADILLVGVSRCGKTPSCLYMALHFGILAANYPFTEEDLISTDLPKLLHPYRAKLFGLTIDPKRLQHIRNERRPNSRYAALQQCQHEVSQVERMYQLEKIPFLNSTHFSIEEIATKIMATAGIARKF